MLLNQHDDAFRTATDEFMALSLGERDAYQTRFRDVHGEGFWLDWIAWRRVHGRVSPPAERH